MSQTFLDKQMTLPSLGHFFKSCFLRYTYVNGCTFTFGTWTHLLYHVSFPCLFLGTCRYVVLLHKGADLYVSQILANFSFFMGEAAFWFILVFFIWYTVACISRVFNELSNFRPQWQTWIKPMIYLEHPEYTRDLPTQRGVRLAILVLRFNLLACVFSTLGVHVPIIVSWPVSWLPLTILHAVNTGFQGYLIGMYEVNFTILIAFYLYVYGRKYHRLAGAPIKVDSSTVFCDFLERFKNRMIHRTRDMFKINRFLVLIMNTIFVGTFMAETLSIYLNFFVDISGATKVIIMLLGFLSFLYGQVICFMFGSYAQHRVQVEMAMLLLMLIANVQRVTPTI